MYRWFEDLGDKVKFLTYEIVDGEAEVKGAELSLTDVLKICVSKWNRRLAAE